MNQARTWTIGLVVVVLLIIVGGWQLGISPIVTQINAANSQAATIQTSNASTESQLASLKLQYAHIGKLRAKLNTLRLSIPEQAAASTFISEVTALGASTGVTIQSVDISVATDYAASTTGDSSTTTSTTTPSTATPTTPGATTTTPTGGGLVDLAVTVNASGPYSEAQSFMGLLQTGTRLFVVNTASLTGSGSASNGLVVMSGNIFTLQGTSDQTTATGSGSGSTSTPTPYPTLTPTATATPTPTSTASTSKTGTSVKKSTPTPTPTGP